MRIAIGLAMAGCLLAAGCTKRDSSESLASSAPSCAAADDLLLKIEGLSENVGMQEAFQAGLQGLPEAIREAAVNRINAKVAADGGRMRAAEGGPRQWVALLLLSTKSEARAVEDFRYCNGDFDFGNGQRWHWTYSMSNGPDGPELRIQSAQMASGGVPTGASTPGPAQAASVAVTGIDIGNALGPDQRVALPLEVLSSGDAAIYAAVATNTSDPDTTVAGAMTAKWTYVDTGQTIFEETRNGNFTGPGVTVFSIRKADGWPVGTYQVEVGLNGGPAQARRFQVAAAVDEGAGVDAVGAADAAAYAAAEAAADAADAGAEASARERERARIADEKQQLERDRRELARQREQVAAQRAAADADATRQAREQEQAWRDQQEAVRGPSADEQYESRRRECPGGFLGSECRKKIREQVCAGHWSSSPAPGYSTCRN